MKFLQQLTNSLTKQRKVLPEKLTVPLTVKEIPRIFMYPESSLPKLLQPTTPPYLKPDQSSPFLPNLRLEDPF